MTPTLDRADIIRLRRLLFHNIRELEETYTGKDLPDLTYDILTTEAVSLGEIQDKLKEVLDNAQMTRVQLIPEE